MKLKNLRSRQRAKARRKRFHRLASSVAHDASSEISGPVYWAKIIRVRRDGRVLWRPCTQDGKL